MVVSRKWPRWLVPSCSSNPSFVRSSGVAITPACWQQSPCQPHEKGSVFYECLLLQVLHCTHQTMKLSSSSAT